MDGVKLKIDMYQLQAFWKIFPCLKMVSNIYTETKFETINPCPYPSQVHPHCQEAKLRNPKSYPSILHIQVTNRHS